MTRGTKAASRKELAEIAGRRWTIEACFEAAKGEMNLDHSEGRS